MNITKTDIDELNAELKIVVEPGDYREKVDTILRDHRKKAAMPGFRPGKVPMGMIKKMYGNAVLADELNKLLSDSLYKYISENNLEVLGNPMPKEDEQVDISLNKDEFEFTYDLGLAPAFDVQLSEKEKFTHYKIKVYEELIEKYVKDIAKQNGTVSEIEVAEDEDLIQGKLEEVDDAGELVENGINSHSTIAIEFVEDKTAKAQLVGLKPGDTAVIDPKKVNKSDVETGKMLDIPVEQVEALTAKFRLTVETVNRMHPAELNTELFDKTFGPGQVTDEAGFREKISTDLGTMFERDAKRKLKRDVQDRLIEKLALELPNEFLKKWLVRANEEIDADQVEKDYENYAKDLRWRLIENKIVKDQNLTLEESDILDRAVESLKRQFAAYGGGLDDNFYKDFAQKMIAKEEERRKIVDELIDERLTEVFLTTFKLSEKEVSFDEFVNLVTGKPAKNKFMDNLNNLLKF